MGAQQRGVGGIGEARVLCLDGVAQGDAVVARGQQIEELRDLGGIEAAGGGELPQDGAELGAEFGDAGGQEMGDRGGELGRVAAVAGGAGRLDREHEVLGHRVAPADEAFAGLGAIEGGVDLDGGEAGGGVGELLGFRQAGWVEAAAPGGEIPAADADGDARGRTQNGISSSRSPPLGAESQPPPMPPDCLRSGLGAAPKLAGALAR